jgi:hypothetical protein
VTGVHVLTIREIGDGVVLIVGHVVPRIDKERLPERPPVHGTHSVGAEDSLDRRHGHVKHT